ncbi:hypothetical protein IAU60_001805 [Kwoniella sp. DSM 27419]
MVRTVREPDPTTPQILRVSTSSAGSSRRSSGTSPSQPLFVRTASTSRSVLVSPKIPTNLPRRRVVLGEREENVMSTKTSQSQSKTKSKTLPAKSTPRQVAHTPKSHLEELSRLVAGSTTRPQSPMRSEIPSSSPGQSSFFANASRPGSTPYAPRVSMSLQTGSDDTMLLDIRPSSMDFSSPGFETVNPSQAETPGQTGARIRGGLLTPANSQEVSSGSPQRASTTKRQHRPADLNLTAVSRLPTPPASQSIDQTLSVPPTPKAVTQTSRIRARPSPTPPRRVSAGPSQTAFGDITFEWDTPLRLGDEVSPNPRLKKSARTGPLIGTPTRAKRSSPSSQADRVEVVLPTRRSATPGSGSKSVDTPTTAKPGLKGKGRASKSATPGLTEPTSRRSSGGSRRSSGGSTSSKRSSTATTPKQRQARTVPSTAPVGRRTSTNAPGTVTRRSRTVTPSEAGQTKGRRASVPASLRTPAHKVRARKSVGMTPKDIALRGRKLGMLPRPIIGSPGDDPLLLRGGDDIVRGEEIRDEAGLGLSFDRSEAAESGATDHGTRSSSPFDFALTEDLTVIPIRPGGEGIFYEPAPAWSEDGSDAEDGVGDDTFIDVRRRQQERSQQMPIIPTAQEQPGSTLAEEDPAEASESPFLPPRQLRDGSESAEDVLGPAAIENTTTSTKVAELDATPVQRLSPSSSADMTPPSLEAEEPEHATADSTQISSSSNPHDACEAAESTSVQPFELSDFISPSYTSRTSPEPVQLGDVTQEADDLDWDVTDDSVQIDRMPSSSPALADNASHEQTQAGQAEAETGILDTTSVSRELRNESCEEQSDLVTHEGVSPKATSNIPDQTAETEEDVEVQGEISSVAHPLSANDPATSGDSATHGAVPSEDLDRSMLPQLDQKASPETAVAPIVSKSALQTVQALLDSMIRFESASLIEANGVAMTVQGAVSDVDSSEFARSASSSSLNLLEPPIARQAGRTPSPTPSGISRTPAGSPNMTPRVGPVSSVPHAHELRSTTPLFSPPPEIRNDYSTSPQATPRAPFVLIHHKGEVRLAPPTPIISLGAVARDLTPKCEGYDQTAVPTNVEALVDNHEHATRLLEEADRTLRRLSAARSLSPSHVSTGVPAERALPAEELDEDTGNGRTDSGEGHGYSGTTSEFCMVANAAEAEDEANRREVEHVPVAEITATAAKEAVETPLDTSLSGETSDDDKTRCHDGDVTIEADGAAWDLSTEEIAASFDGGASETGSDDEAETSQEEDNGDIRPEEAEVILTFPEEIQVPLNEIKPETSAEDERDYRQDSDEDAEASDEESEEVEHTTPPPAEVPEKIILSLVQIGVIKLEPASDDEDASEAESAQRSLSRCLSPARSAERPATPAGQRPSSLSAFPMTSTPLGPPPSGPFTFRQASPASPSCGSKRGNVHRATTPSKLSHEIVPSPGTSTPPTHPTSPGASADEQEDQVTQEEQPDAVEDVKADTDDETEQANQSVVVCRPRRSLHDELSAARDDEQGAGDDSFRSVVEVSSLDPKAAARAAAILKLNHAYIEHGVVPRSRSAAATAQGQPFAQSRNKSMTASYRKDHQELLYEAELELVESYRRSRSRSTSVAPAPVPSDSPYQHDRGRSMSVMSFMTEDYPVPGGYLRTPRPGQVKRKRPVSPLPPTGNETSLGASTQQNRAAREEARWGVTEWKKLEKVYRKEKELWIAQREVKSLPGGLIAWARRSTFGRSTSSNKEDAEVKEWNNGTVVDKFLEKEHDKVWDREMLQLRVEAIERRVNQIQKYGLISSTKSAKGSDLATPAQKKPRREDGALQTPITGREARAVDPPSTIRRMLGFVWGKRPSQLQQASDSPSTWGKNDLMGRFQAVQSLGDNENQTGEPIIERKASSPALGTGDMIAPPRSPRQMPAAASRADRAISTATHVDATPSIADAALATSTSNITASSSYKRLYPPLHPPMNERSSAIAKLLSESQRGLSRSKSSESVAGSTNRDNEK